MKSKLLMFIAILFASTSASLMQAQTDVTATYITNPSFSGNADGWSNQRFDCNPSVSYNVFEYYRDNRTSISSCFSLSQTLTGISEGVYRLTANGFNRTSTAGITNVILYGETTDKQYQVNLKSLGAETGEYGSTPNSKETASAAFFSDAKEGGYWLNTLDNIIITDGKLVIGVTNNSQLQTLNNNNSWTCFSNFKLYELTGAELRPLFNKIITEAEDLAILNYSGVTDLNTAISTANSIADADIVYANIKTLQEAITAYKTTSMSDASASQPIDATFYIKNAGFESGGSLMTLEQVGGSGTNYALSGGGGYFNPIGWTTTIPGAATGNGNTWDGAVVSDNGCKAIATGGLVNPTEGNYYYSIRKRWNPGSISIEQELSTLPAGLYKISVDLGNCTGVTTTGTFTASIEGNSVFTATPNTSEFSTFTSSPFTVNEGELVKLIMAMNGGSDYRIMMDNITLVYYGDPIPALKLELNNQLNTLATYATNVPSNLWNTGGALLTAREAGLTEYNNASSTEESLNTAITTVSSANTLAASLVTPYKDALAILAICEEIAANSVPETVTAETVFNNVVTTARTNIETITTVAAMTDLYTTLENARQTYVVVADPTNGISFDMTFFVKNPTMDTASDWTWDGTTGNNFNLASNKTSTAVGGAFVGTFYESWRANNITGRMYQEVSDLPDGIYSLKAGAFAQNTTGTNATGAYLYGNDAKTAITTNEANFYIVNAIPVVGGAMEIGIRSEEATNNWLGLDNVSIYFYGFDKTAAYTGLTELIAIAQLIISEDMQSTVKSALQEAITAAQVITQTSTKTEFVTATTNLSTAIDNANASITEYAKLQTAIDKAENYLTEITTPSQNAKNTFQAAITIAETVVTERIVATTSEVIATLEVAQRTYLMAQPTPANLTMFLTNPSFESGDNTGWGEFADNQTGGRNYGVQLDNTTDGDYNYYYTMLGRMRHANISQYVTLPAGTYTIEADVQGNPIPEKKTYLYVTTGGINHWANGASYNNDLVVFDGYVVTSALQNTNQWETLKATFTLDTESSIRFGILSWGYNTDTDTEKRGNFKMDNFRLVYRGEGAIDVNNNIIAVKGTVNKTELNNALAQNITSVEFTEVTLTGDDEILAQNPNTIAYGLDAGVQFNGINSKLTSGAIIELDEDFAFNAPTGFETPQGVILKRSTFPGTVNHTEIGGWQTLCLPFDVDMDNISCDDKPANNLIPITLFEGTSTGKRPFWLYRADAAECFVAADTIWANVPYIVLFPNDDSDNGYNEYYNISGIISFVGTAIEATEIKSENSGNSNNSYFLNSNFAPVTDATKYGLDANGANFESGVEVKSFAAYATDPTSSGVRILPIFGGEPTGLLDGITLDSNKNLFVYTAGNGIVGIISPKACKVSVYTLDGKAFGTYDLSEGKNEITLPVNENGNKYIINGNVVIVY